MNERELTTKVLNKLQFQTGLSATVTDCQPVAAGADYANAVIRFDSSNRSLVALLNRWGPDSNAAYLLDQIAAVTGSHDKILISDYISDEVGQRLRESKYNYLDKAGNAFLDIAPIYVLIEGKLPREVLDHDKTPRLFNETGLKVIFALLATPDLLNANYRKIADHANVSMGTIGWVLRELKDQGFTKESYRQKQWADKPRLIKKWTEEYPKLRTKNHIANYRVSNKDWWKEVDLNKYQAVLGGELAAPDHQASGDVRNSTVYVGKQKQGSLVRDLDLVKVEKNTSNMDQGYTIEIMEKFWGSPELSMVNKGMTHPLVTYADLMDAWEPASREIAHSIAEHYGFYKKEN